MNKFGGSFWNERYSEEKYVYGREPNSFFKEQIDLLKPGRILMPGEGEGRNGVYAAGKGWEVDSIDFSSEAKEKALRLAADKDVRLNYALVNLEDYEPAGNYYDAAGLIFLHLNKKIRKKVYTGIYKALKRGGTIIMIVYSKEQLGRTSGGPQNAEMLYSTEEIKKIFRELQLVMMKKEIIYLSESTLHSGEASVIKFVGKKKIK